MLMAACRFYSCTSYLCITFTYALYLLMHYFYLCTCIRAKLHTHHFHITPVQTPLTAAQQLEGKIFKQQDNTSNFV